MEGYTEAMRDSVEAMRDSMEVMQDTLDMEVMDTHMVDLVTVLVMGLLDISEQMQVMLTLQAS